MCIIISTLEMGPGFYLGGGGGGGGGGESPSHPLFRTVFTPTGVSSVCDN